MARTSSGVAHGQDPGGVPGRLRLTQMGLPGPEIGHMCPLVVRPDLERRQGAGGGLLEEKGSTVSTTMPNQAVPLRSAHANGRGNRSSWAMARDVFVTINVQPFRALRSARQPPAESAGPGPCRAVPAVAAALPAAGTGAEAELAGFDGPGAYPGRQGKRRIVSDCSGPRQPHPRYPRLRGRARIFVSRSRHPGLRPRRRLREPSRGSSLPATPALPGH